MNKKLIGILAALVVLGTSNVFALGIGAQGGASPVAGSGVNGGGALTFSLDKTGPIFALDVAGWNNSLYLGLTFDWWAANPKISGGFGYFYGIGGAAGLYGFDNGLTLYAGIRPFIGLNWFVVPPFELYLDVAWQPGFTVGLNSNGGGFGFSPWRFPVNFGFRFWI